MARLGDIKITVDPAAKATLETFGVAVREHTNALLRALGVEKSHDVEQCPDCPWWLYSPVADDTCDHPEAPEMDTIKQLGPTPKWCPLRDGPQLIRFVPDNHAEVDDAG